MGLKRFSWREICSRPLRVFLTFLSITIGVGAVLAVLLATATTRQAQRDILNTISGKADIEIVASGGGFPYQVLKEVAKDPGVEAAVPGLNRFAVLFTSDERKARTQVLGIDPRIDQTVRDYVLIEGQMPTSLKQIILDKGFAKSLEIKVGDQVKMLAKSGLHEYSVVGLVQPSAGSSVALGSAVYVVLPTAQKAFRTGNNIDQIQIVATDKKEIEQTIQRLKAIVPNEATVRGVRTSSNLAQETTFAPQNGLHMAIAFAVIIAMFIIYNTFQMAVGERRKQLGILRAIGATPSQIQWMILRESLWISIAGCIAGCFLGVYGAGWLNGATETLLQVELPNIAIIWWPFAVAIGVGVSVSLLGALIPARNAALVQPMEAIRAVQPANEHSILKYSVPAAIVALLVGGVLIYLGGIGVAFALDVVGVIFVLIGCVLLIPTVLQPACSLIAKWLEPWLGIATHLAYKQLLRHVGRTSMTIGVLFIALATSIGMAGNVLDNVRNVKTWYSRTIIGDFFVRASLPDFSSGAAADLPDTVEDQVAQIAGIEKVEGMRFASIQSNDESLMLIVKSFLGEPTQFLDIDQGTPEQAWQGLANHQVVIGSVLALRRNLQVGDTLSLQTADGSVALPIAAIANDYFGGGLTVYMDRQLARELLGLEGLDGLIIKAQPGQNKVVEAALQVFCRQEGLILQSYADLVGMIDGMVNSVVASLWMLLALGCSIATMGLVNTLTMNILEQTREIGMLRVVAMTRSQVRRMICTQALMLGLLGILPGVLVGIFVQYSVGLASTVVLGHDVVFTLRPGLFIGAAVIGMLLVMAASWIPAERAARLKLAAALQYE
jgi:putative ABC transport system permease protein